MIAELANLVKNSGMRKIGSLLSIQALTALVTWRNVLTGEQYVTLTVAVIAGIVGGNAFEHSAKSKVEIAKANGEPAQEAPKP